MSDHPRLERFHLKNLDCANCAAKIENGLRQVPGVHEAVVDFATLTLHVKTDDHERVVEAVRRMEPHVEVLAMTSAGPAAHQDSDIHTFELKTKMALLAAALVFFTVYLLIEMRFSATAPVALRTILILAAYLLSGWNVFRGAAGTLRRGAFFDENVLMVIATVGALAIGAYSEAIAVMIFYKIGELLQETAVHRSRRSIKALLAAKPSRAAIITETGITETTPEAVSVGDTIRVKPGEKIPLDGDVIEGRSFVDTAALTGESVPVPVAPGDAVMAGQINQSGVLTVRVTRPFVESSIAKVMDLVENATARKARTENFMTTLARYYTPAVVIIAAAIALAPPLLSGTAFKPWIYRALVILVISCPCALVVSIPLGYFGGIGRASREGILVKGSNYIDALASVKTMIFDKTGTLTQGVFNVKEVVNLNGYSPDILLEMAAAAELGSNHPIAAAILSACENSGCRVDSSLVDNHIEMSGQGVTASYNGRSVIVGNDRLLHLFEIDHHRCDFDSTVAHVVVDNNYAGYITIGDELRPDAAAAVNALRAHGITHVAMLTGDNDCAARGVSRKLGLDSYHADLLPEDKVRIFETLGRQISSKRKIAFVGDGINDAPAIARADVGMAMGGIGSDAAVETADVVLMGDSPMKAARSITIARQTRRIVWQNIILAFVIKAVFISFGAVGMATMWAAVFADMGTALAAVANSTRILNMKLT